MADDPQKPASDFLDQAEIDKLLAQNAEQAAPQALLIHADGKRGDAKAGNKVEAYDFRNPVFLSEVELRRLRLLHEDFIRYLSARLSLFLRMEFGLKMAKLTTVTYSKFTDITLNVLSSLTLADLEEPGAKNVLREKLVAAYNQAFGKRVVDQVYFSDFVIQ